MSSLGAAGASGADSDSMKRAAVKNLIERYFRQLTEGCGNPSCANPHCFSSGAVETMTRDQAAAAALQLFKNKSHLCLATSPDHHAFKIPRSSARPSDAASSSGAESHGSGAVAASGSSTSSEDSLRTNVITVAATSQQHSAPLALDSPATTTPTTSSKQSGSSSSSSSSSAVKSKKSASKLNTGASGSSSSKGASPSKAVTTLDEDKLVEILAACKATDSYSLLIRTLGETFNNPESLMASFRQKIPVKHLSKEDRSVLEGDKDKDTDDLMDTDDADRSTAEPGGNDDGAPRPLEASPSSPSLGAPSTSTTAPTDADLGVLAASESAALSNDELSLDLDSLRRCYKALFEDNKVSGRGFRSGGYRRGYGRKRMWQGLSHVIKKITFTLQDIPCIAPLVSALFLLAGDVEMDLRYRMAYER